MKKLPLISLFVAMVLFVSSQNDYALVRVSEFEDGMTPVLLSHVADKTYVKYNLGPIRARMEYAFSFDSNLVSAKLNYVPQKDCCPKELHSPVYKKMEALRDKDGIIHEVSGFKFPDKSAVQTILGENEHGFFLYTTCSKSYFYDGYGIVEVDQNLNILRKTEIKISEAVKAEDAKHPSKNGIPNLMPSKVFVRPDNSLVLLMEEIAAIAQGPVGTPGSLTVQSGCGYTLCFFLDKDLKETSTAMIKKSQSGASVNSSIMSYNAYERGGYIYIFYNGSFRYEANEAKCFMQVITPDNKLTEPIMLTDIQPFNLLLNESTFSGRPIMKVSDDEIHMLAITGAAWGEKGARFRLVDIKFLKPVATPAK